MQNPMLSIAVKAARAAGEYIARAIDRPDRLRIRTKQKNDFVTHIDELAEQTIIEIIQTTYPSHTIFAEESSHPGTAIPNDEYVWIIDPLDGTTNFIHGFPQCAVSIALRYRNNIAVAVIYDPLKNELFTAVRGEGAQLNHQKIRVSGCNKLSDALIGIGLPARHPDNLKFYLQVFGTLFPKTSGMRRAGSAALDLAYVASGRLDGFWEGHLAPWDIAAGTLLVREAGGLISDFSNTDCFLETGCIIAGNPKMHQAILDILHPLTD